MAITSVSLGKTLIAFALLHFVLQGQIYLLFQVLGASKVILKIDVLFIIGVWNTKVGSQETPGVTGKFGLGIQNEAGQRLTEFCQENALVIANISLFQQPKR